MSIVEKALQKMQGAGPKPSGAAAASPVFGKVVDAARHRSPATPPVRSARLVAINQPALRAAGLLPPEHQERQIANEYRQIKRPLVANAIGRGTPKLPHGQLIMVASAMPGEGKTFTSLNLAFSMSLEKDAHVLLVDADVAKPHVSRLLGLAEEPGLLDALADPVLDAEALVMGTDVPNLAVLPAGHREEHATELLASARMEEIMRRIAEADPARIVVFDSPPLLLTTESRALAEAAGQVVLVVRADTTPQHVVLDALSYLPEGKNIFLLLNQSVQGGRSGYYYGYGYASGSASGSTAEGQTRPE